VLPCAGLTAATCPLCGPEMLPVACCAAAGSNATDSSLPPTPTSCPARTVVTFNGFCGVMEEVLATRRGPRAYLAPSPPKKYVPTETYKPQINQRSKQLASRVRPKVGRRRGGRIRLYFSTPSEL
jgi:hypothetical protein